MRHMHADNVTNTHLDTHACQRSRSTSDPKGHSVTSGRAKGGRRGQQSKEGKRERRKGWKTQRKSKRLDGREERKKNKIKRVTEKRQW